MAVLYRGRILNFPELNRCEDIRDGYILVDRGKILSYGSYSEKEDRSEEEVDLSGLILMPGFIDLHTHISQFRIMGQHQGRPLLNWLFDYVFEEEKRFGDIGYAKDTAEIFFSELTKAGTVVSMIYSSIHRDSTDTVFESAAAMGVKTIIGKVLMDTDLGGDYREERDKAIETSLYLFDRWNGYEERLFYVFSPRFALSSTEELLEKVGVIAKERGSYIQTHLSESMEEVESVLERFPHYSSYTELYRETGILGPRTIVAHAIHLREEEYRILRDTDTRVAHCPTSNIALKSGRMDIKRMLAHGIKVGLGTDIGAGSSLSMFAVIQDALSLNPLEIETLFYLATLGGAKALNMDNLTGSLASGKDADFIVIRPNRDISGLSTEQILYSLLPDNNGCKVVKTFLRGRELFSE